MVESFLTNLPGYKKCTVKWISKCGFLIKPTKSETLRWSPPVFNQPSQWVRGRLKCGNHWSSVVEDKLQAACLKTIEPEYLEEGMGNHTLASDLSDPLDKDRLATCSQVKWEVTNILLNVSGMVLLYCSSGTGLELLSLICRCIAFLFPSSPFFIPAHSSAFPFSCPSPLLLSFLLSFLQSLSLLSFLSSTFSPFSSLFFISRKYKLHYCDHRRR